MHQRISMLDVFMKLSHEDRRVIVQCMRLLLDGDWFFPGEENARMGVWGYELREVMEFLTQAQDADNVKSVEATKLSPQTIGLAIHNSLNEVSAGIDIDDDALAHYGLSCQLVDRVCDHLIAASGWAGGIA